ncbi:MAG: hypothetical protein Q8K32_00365 [Archangium sp.]|nr:hypothetical protein [Archangium sp.]
MTPLITLLLLAQSPEQLRTVFPQQAAVRLEGRVGAWARLPLPDVVLRQVDRDLADVRLFDASGKLVPFVVQRERPFEAEQRVWLTQVSASRQETAADPGTPHFFEETATFALPSQRARTPRLEFNSHVSRFVRRAVIEALTEKGVVVARIETTLFRLPGTGERMEVWLPALEKDAQRLRVTLNGQDDGFITPTAVATFAERGPPETTLAWPITQSPQREGTSTVWQLEKPRGIAPMRLSVKTTTPWFNREVTVRSASGELGRGRVFRQAGSTPVERLELPLAAISDEHLEVRIEDEDSPMLEQLELAFVIEQPELVFVTPPSQPVTLFFGGHRTRRAHFDTSDNEVRLPFDLAPAPLGEPQKNPEYVPTSPLAEFRKAGAALEVAPFPLQAWVRGVSGTEVSSVTFTATHAQTMAPDFRDLRLVDGQGLQWPYVLHESTATLPVALTAASAELTGHSAWTFSMGGRVASLTLLPPAGVPYFSRNATLSFAGEGLRPVQVWSGWLTSNPNERGVRTELVLWLDGKARGEGTYTLDLDDGGDAPLNNLSLEAVVKVPQLTALLAAGDYRAVWGVPTLRAPRYDVERVSEVLRELRTTPHEAERAETNPAFIASTWVERTGGVTRWIFWAVLALAVLVLGGLTVRIARADPGTPPPQ